MNQKNTVTIPAELIPEFEAWGEMTVKLFGWVRKDGLRHEYNNYSKLG